MNYRAFRVRSVGLAVVGAVLLSGCSRANPSGLEPTRTIAPAPSATPVPDTPAVANTPVPTPRPLAALTRDTVGKMEQLYTRNEQLPATIYAVADDRIGVYNGVVFEVFSSDTLESLHQTLVPKDKPGANWYALSADAHIGGIMYASGTLDLYDLDTGAKYKTLTIKEKPSNNFASDFALNIDGSEAVIVAEQVLYRIDTGTGEQIGESKELGADVGALRFLSDGRYVVLLLRGGGLAVVNTLSHERVELDSQFNSFSGVTLSPDGKRVGVMSEQTLSIWDAESGKQIWSVDQIEEPIAVAFSPTDPNAVVIYGSSGAVSYDLDKRADGRTFQLTGGGGVRSAEFSLDGKKLFVQGNGRIERFDLAKGTREATVQRFGISRLSFTAEDRIVGWSDTIQNGEITSIDVADGKTINSMLHDSPIRRTIVSASGKYAASSTLGDDMAVWQLSTGKKIFDVNNVQGIIMCVSPDEANLVYFIGGSIVLRDIASESVRKSIKSTQDELFNLATCENEKGYFALQSEKAVEIMALDGRSVATIALTKPISEAVDIEFSRDGKFLSIVHDEAVRVYETDTGAEKTKFEAKTGLQAAQFAKNSNYIVVSANDAVSVGEISTGKLTELDIPRNYSVDFNFPPDDSIFVTTARIADPDSLQAGIRPNFTAGEIAVWDIKTGKQLRKIPLDQPVTAAALNNDGSRLATANFDGSMTVWGIK